MAFYVNQTKFVLSFELDEEHICTETLIAYDSNRPTKLYIRSYDKNTDSTTIAFGANLKLTKKSQDVILGNTINNCSVLAAFGKSNVERTRLNDVYEYFAYHIREVLTPDIRLSDYVKAHLSTDEHGELKRFLLNFLRASDFNIEDIALHKGDKMFTSELRQLISNASIDDKTKEKILNKGRTTNLELMFTHHAGEKKYTLPEENESNGTIRLLGMAVILNLLLREKQFVAIDEVESSIHYELLSYFIKVFLANSNQTSQLLLTTHDINLLNEDFIRRDTIWFTDKDELGETKLARLSSLGLHKNLSPYNAYRQGKLVKLPFLGSQYLNLND